MPFDTEFKKALQLLPNADKDKLILRLLRKNVDVANKLYFELVDTETVEHKREKLQERIVERVNTATNHYYSAGYLLMDMRWLSGEITEHVKVTKDKTGDISLNCLMLTQLLQLNNPRIAAETPGNAHTLCIYIVARIFKILMLLQKQHHDLHLDFKKDIETLGRLVGNNKNVMKTAIFNGLDVNWLILFNIPDNIAGIYKNVREKGLLR